MRSIQISAMNSIEGKSVICNLKNLLSRKDIKFKTVDQVRKENPDLFYDNGNYVVEHAEIADYNLTKIILKLIDKELNEDKKIDIGSQWNNCNGKWWNQFTVRIYDKNSAIGNTIFHSTGQAEYDYLIDEIIELINNPINVPFPCISHNNNITITGG